MSPCLQYRRNLYVQSLHKWQEPKTLDLGPDHQHQTEISAKCNVNVVLAVNCTRGMAMPVTVTQEQIIIDRLCLLIMEAA